METAANNVRFSESFNFATPVQTSRRLGYVLLLSPLCSFLRHGTGRAYSVGMSKNTENSNTQNDPLPLIRAEQFKREVLESKQPVLVEFWTPWSRPCEVFDSVLQELAGTCGDKFKVFKVNADDSLDLSLWYDIQSVPTLLYFIRGNPCLRIVGTASKEAILAELKFFPE